MTFLGLSFASRKAKNRQVILVAIQTRTQAFMLPLHVSVVFKSLSFMFLFSNQSSCVHLQLLVSSSKLATLSRFFSFHSRNLRQCWLIWFLSQTRILANKQVSASKQRHRRSCYLIWFLPPDQHTCVHAGQQVVAFSNIALHQKLKYMQGILLLNASY